MKSIKKLSLLMILVIAIVTTLTGCSKTKGVKIEAENPSIDVVVGSEVNLKLSITENKKFTKDEILANLEYTSSDAKIVKIEENKIKAIGVGSAKVTAAWKEDKNIKAEVTVNVTAPVIGELHFQGIPTLVYVNDTFTIAHDGKEDVKVTYETTTKDVVKVEGAKVTALKAGEAVIIAKATNGYIESDASFTIKFTVNQGEYKITYDLDGGKNSVDNPSMYDVRELPLVLKEATKQGYKFLGWYDNAEFNGKAVTEIKAGAKGDVKLFAKWEKIIVKSKINYVLNDGTLKADAPKEYTEGEETILPIPERAGYTFLGWSYFEDSNVYVEKIAKIKKGDVTVYAHWEKIPVYSKVTYVLNEGKLPEGAKDKYEEGVAFTLPTPTRTDYIFLGWTYEKEGTSYITEIATTKTGDVTVYAHWEKAPVVSNITYNLDGGKLEKGYPTEYTEGVGAKLPTPTKAGNKFLGWTLEEGTTSYITEITKESTGDVLVYANWEELVAGPITVGPTETYKTIAEALKVVPAGGTIKLLAGTYEENVTINVANITIIGPNEGTSGSASRQAEAIIKGVITIGKGIQGITIDGLYFTGNARVLGPSGNMGNFTFINNLVKDSTVKAPKEWATTDRYNNSGIVNFAYNDVPVFNNGVFENNRFENIQTEAFHVSRVNNVVFDSNVIINFKDDAIRIDGGYCAGYMSFTNNTFEVAKVGDAQMGIYLRSYSGNHDYGTQVVIKGNKFTRLGGQVKADFTPNGAIGSWVYQECGANVVITDNIFDHCYNGIYLRNNGATLSTYTAEINNNEFLGEMNDYYFRTYSQTDTESTNPHAAVFGANYYEDNAGKVITDMKTIAGKFFHAKTIGTALSAKPTHGQVEKTSFFTITYELKGGELKADNMFVAGYEVKLPKPSRSGWSFLGWTLVDGTTDYIEVIEKTNKNDVTLYAQWQRESAFIVTYDHDGGVSNELYLKKAKPAATLTVNNFNYNEGGFWSNANYEKCIFLGDNTCDPTATFSDRLYIGKDEVTGLWTVKGFIEQGTGSSWVEGAKYVLTVSSSYKDFWTNHAIIVDNIKVGQVVAFSKPVDQMNAATPGDLTFYNEAPAEDVLTLDVTTNDELVKPSKLGFKFLGWFDATSKKYETVFDLTDDVTLKAHWEELTPVTDITVNQIPTEMRTDDVFQIEAKVVPTDAFFQDIYYATSDKDVITVDENGKLTAVNAGKATITVRDYMSKKVLKFEITVYSIESIHVDFEEEFDGILTKGEQIQIHANALGKDVAGRIFTYTSSNDKVITVDEAGMVKAIADGEAYVTVKDNSGSNFEVKVTFIVSGLSKEDKVNQVMTLIAENNFAVTEAGNVSLYNDGHKRYYDSIYGSVNRFLFDEFTINRSYEETATNNPNCHKDRRPGIDTVEFVTVHDTATLTGTVESIAKNMSSNETSIHYTVGNDEIFSVVPEKFIAYHAADGTRYSYSWQKSGIKVTDPAKWPTFDLEQVGTDWYLTINGKRSNVTVPMSDGKRTIQNPSKKHFSNLGPIWDIENGEYVIAPLRTSFQENLDGRICAYGGNNNSIGIEMCVNTTSDIYDTWQRTAKLVADIMLRNNLQFWNIQQHNSWSGKRCPQSVIAAGNWDQFMKMVELNYILQKDYKDVEISMKSNNPDIVDNTGRVYNAPKTTTAVSYTVTVKCGDQVKTMTLHSVVPGTTGWTQWDGSYPVSYVWNNGKYGKLF